MTVTTEEIALCLTELVHRSDNPERDVKDRRDEVWDTYQAFLRELADGSNNTC